ncbi:hypothetical protein J1614_010164 [Plenodomus biglobosus]|nr:hypothetical protein J1614_010164 [Plenodomus biglobosus]
MYGPLLPYVIFFRSLYPFQAVEGEKSITERHSEPLLPEFLRDLLRRVPFGDAPESTLFKASEVLVRDSARGNKKESYEQDDVSSEDLETRGSMVQAGGPRKRGSTVQAGGPGKSGSTVQAGGPRKRGSTVQAGGPGKRGAMVQAGGPTKRSKGMIQKGGPTKRSKGMIQKGGPTK